MKATHSVVEELTALGVEYQPYYPRFIVDVRSSLYPKSGTVEILSKAATRPFNFGIETQRDELERMTIASVLEQATEKAKAGDWMIKAE